MKTYSKFFVFILGISLFNINSFANGNLKWHSFDEGMAKAKAENKVLLVDFYTDWCGWCKKMDKATYENEKVITYLNKHFVAVKLNPEKDEAVTYKGEKINAANFSNEVGANGFPSTGFFKSNEEFLGTVPGYIPPEDFIELLDKVLAAKDQKSE